MINLKRKKKTLDDVLKSIKFLEVDKNYINNLYESMKKCYGMV